VTLEGRAAAGPPSPAAPPSYAPRFSPSPQACPAWQVHTEPLHVQAPVQPAARPGDLQAPRQGARASAASATTSRSRFEKWSDHCIGYPLFLLTVRLVARW